MCHFSFQSVDWLSARKIFNKFFTQLLCRLSRGRKPRNTGVLKMKKIKLLFQKGQFYGALLEKLKTGILNVCFACFAPSFTTANAHHLTTDN